MKYKLYLETNKYECQTARNSYHKINSLHHEVGTPRIKINHFKHPSNQLSTLRSPGSLEIGAKSYGEKSLIKSPVLNTDHGYAHLLTSPRHHTERPTSIEKFFKPKDSQGDSKQLKEHKKAEITTDKLGRKLNIFHAIKPSVIKSKLNLAKNAIKGAEFGKK